MKKTFRTVISVLMLLVMLCAMLPAQAASDLISNDVPKTENGKTKEVVISRGKSEVVLITTANTSGTLNLKILDYTNGKALVREENRSVSKGKKIEWRLDFDEQLPLAEKNIKHLVFHFTISGKTYDYSLYLTYHRSNDTITVEKGTWYPDNTACCFGLPLRDMKRPITDKWYHVTPVDLSIQGDQEFLYVASNLYIIGKVTVTVSGDYVFVNYHNYYDGYGGNTETKSEFMTIFHDMSEVTVDPNRAARSFNFGQPISISYDLQGDTNVLLFVLNHVTYCDYVTGTHKLTRFWPNLDEYKAERRQMELLMNRQ